MGIGHVTESMPVVSTPCQEIERNHGGCNADAAGRV